jgi:hypothetical protein
MTAAFVLRELRQRGLNIRAVGSNLRLTPSNLATPDIIERVRYHKAELLAVLGPENAVQTGKAIPFLSSSDACNERDRLAGHGCHYTSGEAEKAASPYLPAKGHPAYSIIATCQQHGVALRIDEEGCLVVGKAGAESADASQPWPALIHAIEAQLDAVARLVEMGWTLRADIPMQSNS